MYKKSLAILLSLIFFKESQSQNTIQLNSEGLISKAPPARVKKGESLQLKIPIDKASMSEYNDIHNRIMYMDSLVKGQIVDEQIQIRKALARVYYFLYHNTCFKEIMLTQENICLRDSFKKNMDSWVTEYKIDKEKMDCDRCECVRQKILELQDLEKKLNDFNQKKQLILDLLCNKDSTEYSIEGDKMTIKFKNGKSEFHPDVLSLGYHYLINDEELKLPENSEDSFYTTTTTEPEFNIKRVKSFSQEKIEWHNKQLRYLDPKQIDSIRIKVNAEAKKIEDLALRLKNCSECRTDDLLSLGELQNALQPFDTVWCAGSPIATWLRNWLWYSHGNLSLNYFEFTSPNPAKYKQNPDTIKNFREIHDKIDSLKKCLHCNIKALDTLQLLQNALDDARDKYSLSTEGRKILEKQQKTLNDALITSSTIHSFQLNEADDKTWILYHNAANKYKPAEQLKLVLPEDNTVYFGIYNAKNPDDTALKITQAKEEFKDQGRFVQELTEALGELSKAASSLGTYYPLVTKFTGDLFGDVQATQVPDPVANQVNNQFLAFINSKSTHKDSAGIQQYFQQQFSLNPLFSSLDLNNVFKLLCESMKKEVIEKLWRWRLLRHMLDQYNSLSTPGKLDVTESTDPGYFTYTIKADDWAAPYTNKYKISYGKKELLSDRYSIGRLRSFTIGTGLFFNQKSARQVTVDAQNNVLSIKNSDATSKFVVGLKIFPCKIFMADDKLIPKYWKGRFSIFTGFEVTKPLDNLYEGIGYDILPGLQVSAGIHIYKRTVYQVQNNVVTDQTSNYKISGFYYGITLDPEVMAALLKTLFKL